MAATDSSQNNGFDPNKALKNYAANMAMSGLYWPTGFDSGTSMFHAAAYSQASALAAAATSMQNLNDQSPSSNGSMSMVSSTNGIGSSGMPYSAATAASLISSTSAMPVSLSSTLSFPAHSTTPSTPKKKPQAVPDALKDETYWDRRKRNNDSARRSRESRRMKEEQIALRVVYLEQENLQLRTEVSMLRNEIEKLRGLFFAAR